MANYSRWDDIKKQRPGPTDEERATIEQDFALGELIFELRTSAGLSQRELAERMGTTQSVISGSRKAEVAAPASIPSPVSPPRSIGTWSCPSRTRCRSASRTPSRSPESHTVLGMAEKVEPPPTATARDRLVEIASSAAGEFPLAGTVVEVLRQIFGTAYEHRREAWLRRLYDLVVELDERGVDVGALAGRPAFVTAVHNASRIAMGEHIEEKLDMLKAVLFNAATRVPDEVSDLWTLRYLRWVDELEPQHIAVLRFGLDPRSWLTEAGADVPEFMSGPRTEVLKLANFPFPVEQMELILEDLRALRLGDVGSGMVTGRSMYDPWITDRGRRFLEWLTVV